jgi:competence protein ComEC
VPRATWFAITVLVVAIGVVELGWRDPSPGLAVDVPVPEALAGIVEELRSQPARHVASGDAAAVASGVVFGRAADVSVADQQAFLDSGLWHLLAASGQNIALVAGCCLVLARLSGAGRTTGAVLALVAIPAYVIVVGGGASIVRAGIMGELAIIAWLAGRLADSRHMLVVVAATICWVWPGAHRGLGMQLSFACVAVLAVGVAALTRTLREHGVPAWLAGVVAASALCSLATAPILQLRTGGAPLTGVVANVVAVPLAGALLVVGLAGSVLTALVGAGIGDVALAPAGALASLLVRIARRAAALPAAQVDAPLITVGVPMLAAGLALVARRPGGVFRMRARRALLVGLVACPVGSIALAAAPTAVPVVGGDGIPSVAPGSLRVAALDVGQGDATLLVLDGHAVLVDAGPPDGRVVERVRALGIDRVDGIVLTHDSLDHRGGFEQAHAALEPSWVARPSHAPGPWQRIRGIEPGLVDLCAGSSIPLGSARIDVLHPPCDGRITPRTGDLHNDGAMVLLVTYGDIRALLPADAEAPVLLPLGLPRLDVLRVAHHGSADQALDELLARTSPRVAVISVGTGNGYGHPTRQALDALDDAGVLTRRTDQDGTVVLDSDGRSLVLVE